MNNNIYNELHIFSSVNIIILLHKIFKKVYNEILQKNV